MGNQGKFTKKQSRKTKCFSIYSRSDFTSGDETYTAGGETPILGLPAFLSRSGECCGRTNFSTVKTESGFDQVLAARATKITSPLL